MSLEGRVIRLDEQPDFPLSDLTESNVDMFGNYLLVHDAGMQVQAELLAQHQRIIFELAHAALAFNNIQVANAPAEYRAFRRGFAAVEFMAQVLRPLGGDGGVTLYNTRRLLIEPGCLADFELSRRQKKWADRHPGIHEAVITAGDNLGETMSQLQARTIGAQVALELRDPFAEAA